MRPEPDEIPSLLKEQIQHLDHAVAPSETGTVFSIGDGVAHLHGLSRAMVGEQIRITTQAGDTLAGLVLALERDSVIAAVFGEPGAVTEGDAAAGTGRLFEVPVGDALLGRVVDALGLPIDGKGPILTTLRGRIEARAPGLAARRPMSEPLLTGVAIIDACVPLARGQRQIVLGDRTTGKTTLAVDTILNQRGKGVFCVYVAIGQSLSEARSVVDLLAAHGAMEYTTVVVTSANQPAPTRHLAPFTGMALGEYFRDTGRHALCVFDDLSKHAVAHGETALLLGRLPGPDGHPVDGLSLHGRLLDRAGNQADRGDPHSGGSLTALALVETQDGDASAHLPALLVELGDGQIALDAARFDSGVRPAVDVGASVSHAGPWARSPGLMRLAGWKSKGGSLRDHLTNHRALTERVRLAPEIDAWTRAQLDQGARLIEIMKQPAHEPRSLGLQILVLFAAVHGLLDAIPIGDLQRFKATLRAFAESRHESLLDECGAARSLDKALEARMRAVIEAVKA
jgi:F-type H+-transporting ATPase subunit alpha